MQTEQWRSIAGFPDYEVSDQGRVRSIDRYVVRSDGVTQFYRGRIIKPRPQKSGHLLVWLRKDSNKTVAKNVHRLVAEAFLGPCPEGMVCCHIVSDPTDNRAVNLRWDTQAENTRQAYREGRAVIMPNPRKGHAHPKSVLTSEMVHIIRTSDLSGVELSKQLGVSQMTISRCRRNHTYA